MKTILVTGGNRGLGLEICRELAEMGHRVILCSRDLQKGRNAASGLSGDVTVMQLDVTDERSVRALVTSVETKFGAIDVLINNAGIGSKDPGLRSSVIHRLKNLFGRSPAMMNLLGKTLPTLKRSGVVPGRKKASDIGLESVKHTMETNFYGPWRMIQAFIPLLQKGNDPRIINMSSGMGELKSLTGISPGYSLSKAALNALTIMFSNELKEKNITVNAMCPGWVRTDMGGPNAPRNVREGADTAVWLATAASVPTGTFFRDRAVIPW